LAMISKADKEDAPQIRDEVNKFFKDWDKRMSKEDVEKVKLEAVEVVEVDNITF
jgi:hypothetical protein